jgi:hypothetical protein
MLLCFNEKWASVELKNAKLYVLLTVHLVIIFVNNQLDAQFFFMRVYFCSLHVSDSYVSIIRRINCINTTSGICHSVSMTVWYVYHVVLIQLILLMMDT